VNILATDTSAQPLVVTLRTESVFVTKTFAGRALQHSERLVPTVQELCSDAGITEKDIDLLVCTRGPGSFTGLRIGMAAFKGMALALDKPLVSVSTLELYARCVPHFDGAVVTVLDAKKQRWYLAAFESRNDEGKHDVRRLSPDIDGIAEDLKDVLAPYDRILVTGPDAVAFAPMLKEVLGDRTIISDTVSVNSIPAVLPEMGVEKFGRDGADDIGQGPVYLRKSDAEIALEEKQKNGLK
jgi:tRNA threonylcarbamoyladenosine biosynthesis protein TsaB